MSNGIVQLRLADLRAEMARYRIRQQQLAQVLGVSQSYLSLLLHGERIVTIDMLARIATAIDQLKSAKSVSRT